MKTANPKLRLCCPHCQNEFFRWPSQIQNPDRVFCSRKCHDAYFEAHRMEQFWNHVSKTDTCWTWIGSIYRQTGYGRFYIGQDGKKKLYAKAHRLAYELTKGPIPDGLIICHTCDNPSCVNPDHLYAGTWADNMRDRDTRLRHYHGERVNTNKLNEEQVLEIRARYANGETNKSQLAREYGVSNPLIGFIIRGQSWRHLNLTNLDASNP